MQEWPDIVGTLGFPIFIALILLWAAWRLLNVYGERLVKATETNTELSKRVVILIEGQNVDLGHIRAAVNRCDHTATHLAVIELAKAIETISPDDKRERVAEKVREIQRILTQPMRVGDPESSWPGAAG